VIWKIPLESMERSRELTSSTATPSLNLTTIVMQMMLFVKWTEKHLTVPVLLSNMPKVVVAVVVTKTAEVQPQTTTDVASIVERKDIGQEIVPTKVVVTDVLTVEDMDTWRVIVEREEAAEEDQLPQEDRGLQDVRDPQEGLLDPQDALLDPRDVLLDPQDVRLNPQDVRLNLQSKTQNLRDVLLGLQDVHRERGPNLQIIDQLLQREAHRKTRKKIVQAKITKKVPQEKKQPNKRLSSFIVLTKKTHMVW